jgi:uncharacterized Zn finger protein (UPF0148 family)
VKKCPECGNPSYDGAPICGNCGYKFPKPKVSAPKSEDIFQQEPKKEKKSNDEDTVSIIKRKKLVIGIIILITLIVICGIVLTGSNTTNSKNSDSNPIIQTTEDLAEYSGGDFSFKYPKAWKKINGTDAEHPGAVFFQNKDKVVIEYYNITSSAKSLKDVTQQRISYAQQNGDYVELVETVTLDGRNASNMLFENADGDYTRYVSMFSDGKLYVFKVSGSSENSLTSQDIENTINSADIA